MSWLDDIVKKLDPEVEHLVNDSKTPSGKVHVGSLRGPLIHDCVSAFMKLKGFNVQYKYGVDDFDPLDELPRGHEEFYEEYLGQPLCNVPAPKGSDFQDIAKHYIHEFFEIFEKLNIKPETYYLRDYYRSGEFNESIDLFLRNAAKIREINLAKSGAVRGNDWHPLQVICEKCGKVGTTEVTAYDGKEVEYCCNPNLVKWAKGCGHKGKVSPFDGNGKLPWKFEWAAKWKILGVTIEGAGADHCTKGGSRDVTGACFQFLFKKPAPLNIPYEFFTVGGAKMSSSKGIGSSARAMANFLSPELLRYLMLRTKPNRTVDFRTDQMYMNRLFDDYDKLKQKYISEKSTAVERFVFEISQVGQWKKYIPISFSLASNLIQLPHINIRDEVEKLDGKKLDEEELKILNQRTQSAQHWLNEFATDDEKLVLKDEMPDSSESLNVAQKAFIKTLSKVLDSCDWKEDVIQTTLFDVARMTPVDQPTAFAAIYTVLFDKKFGPKAGNILSYLSKKFVLERLATLDYNEQELIEFTSEDVDVFEKWLKSNEDSISSVSVDRKLFIQEKKDNGITLSTGVGVLEVVAKMHDGKRHMKRIRYYTLKGVGAEIDDEINNFKVYSSDYVKETFLNDKYKLESKF